MMVMIFLENRPPPTGRLQDATDESHCIRLPDPSCTSIRVWILAHPTCGLASRMTTIRALSYTVISVVLVRVLSMLASIRILPGVSDHTIIGI